MRATTPGDVVQQWHDELEAASRKVGRYLSEIKYGPMPCNHEWLNTSQSIECKKCGVLESSPKGEP